ncbi:hypothetical protein [Halocatena marina]|uniref:hypothetical protein n=1 Tax=Halocatena marina TaxID=2934937 RepID=UPI00200E5D40|nr:hypothetical protein [Halocatena marina]
MAAAVHGSERATPIQDRQTANDQLLLVAARDGSVAGDPLAGVCGLVSVFIGAVEHMPAVVSQDLGDVVAHLSLPFCTTPFLGVSKPASTHSGQGMPIGACLHSQSSGRVRLITPHPR